MTKSMRFDFNEASEISKTDYFLLINLLIEILETELTTNMSLNDLFEVRSIKSTEYEKSTIQNNGNEKENEINSFLYD